MNSKNEETVKKVEEAAASFTAANKTPQRSSRGATVTVACKMPHGMFLRLFRMRGRTEAVMGGGMRTFEQAEQVGDIVKINGYAAPFGVTLDHPVAGGYGLTQGVDAEFMEEWLAQNQDLDAVKNGLILVHERHEMVVGQAREQRSLRNGLEPLDPETKKNGRFVDPRIPQKVEKLKQGTPEDTA